jgi:glycosyltransferase involved in cell wall biosynthesis
MPATRKRKSKRPSLMIVGLPHPLTARVYRYAAGALGLRQPTWATDGAFLNFDDFTILRDKPRMQQFLYDVDGPTYQSCLEFARAVLQPFDHAYMLSTQPWLAHELCRGSDDSSSFRVLRLVTYLPDVAYGMLHANWFDVAGIDEGASRLDALVRGLLRADEILRAIPAVEVRVADLLRDPSALPTALARLYPEPSLAQASEPFIDETVQALRESIVEARKTTDHAQFVDLLRRIEATKTAVSPATPKIASRPGDRAESGGERRPILLAIGDAVVPSGFGRVMSEILHSLVDDFEVHQVGLNFLGGPYQLPWIVMPCEHRRGAACLAEAAVRLQPAVIFMLDDLEPLGNYVEALRSIGSTSRLVAYCAVDSGPVHPWLVARFAGLHRLVTFTEFARRELENTAALMPECVTWGAVAVEPHGVDTDTFHPLFPLGNDPVRARRQARVRMFPDDRRYDDAFIVLNANRNQPRKRIDLTMIGFARFVQGREDAFLYLHMGTQDHGWRILDVAELLGISDKLLISVETHGQPDMPSDVLNLVYNVCDVGINTSQREGWGLVPFEHAATGAAQIVGDNTASGALWQGHAELLETHLTLLSTGAPFREYLTSPEAICARLTALYEDPQLLARRSLEAYSFATRESFKWSTIGANWLRLLQAELEPSCTDSADQL